MAHSLSLPRLPQEGQEFKTTCLVDEEEMKKLLRERGHMLENHVERLWAYLTIQELLAKRYQPGGCLWGGGARPPQSTPTPWAFGLWRGGSRPWRLQAGQIYWPLPLLPELISTRQSVVWSGPAGGTGQPLLPPLSRCGGGFPLLRGCCVQTHSFNPHNVPSKPRFREVRPLARISRLLNSLCISEAHPPALTDLQVFSEGGL